MLTNWQQQFPDAAPAAHRLRAAFPNRWVRFHSLPGSKRYPEEEDEYSTVLARHKRILVELTASNRRVVLLSTGYSDLAEPVRLQPDLLMLDPHARPWRSVPMHELDGNFIEPTFW